MKRICSGRLMAVLAAGVMALPGYAAAQTMGTTTGQNPGTISLSGAATSANPTGFVPTPSPFNQPAVPLGPGGVPLQPSISTVPPLPGQPGMSSRTGRAPNEGETDASGRIIHYTMAGHEKGTGYGALEGVTLPPRTFNNVETHNGQ